MLKQRLCGMSVAVALLLSSLTQAETRLLRFPDVHGDAVVFCYAGDIWRASTSGGVAARLTAHAGQETCPKFSPDGEWLAFTAQYDGDEQVYVMPSVGGIPRQLTFYPASGPLAPRWGFDNQVYGWRPDGRQILFRSLRDADGGSVQSALYTVSVEGGLPEKLPMPRAGAGTFSPDGRKLIYSPLFRDFRSWKRYEGGWAQDLYIFDLASREVRGIANSRRTERDPMWIGDTIYFVSDRDGTLNLFGFDLATNQERQLTRSKQWDVRWASSDGTGQIVYESNGTLMLLDARTEKERALKIQVPDDGLASRPSRYAVESNVESFALSPQGERALIVARGDVFSVPIEKGVTRNLTRSSRAHDKHAVWSPDGSQVAFVSDESGEEQVYVVSQDGRGQPEQVTQGLESMLFRLRWSPDGARLSFSDKYGKLHVVRLADKTRSEVADDRFGLLQDYTWSPCGQHIVLTLRDANEFGSLYLWSVADGQLRRVTSELTDESNPVWDPLGNYLFYLSRRQFAPQISNVEWNYAGNRETGIFGLALRKDVQNLFPPEDDEVSVTSERGSLQDGKDDEDQEKPAKAKEADIVPPTKIDFDALSERVVRVPVEADNYANLAAIEGHLLYLEQDARFYGRASKAKTKLKIFEFEKRKAHDLAEDVSDFVISQDGAKVLLRSAGKLKLYDAKPNASDAKSVSTKGLKVDRVPAEEWEEVFDEVWRRFRDFFYVRNMHGYDWEAIGEQYRSLLPHVGHRSDLNYVISEMIAELNAGHCYIQGGDYETPDRPVVGLPGARFELDAAAGRYRLVRIFPGANEEPKYRSPLTEIGVDVAEGDYVLAIDGQTLDAKDNPYRLLRDKTQLVALTVNDRPHEDGAREITYRPIASEQSLLYLAWVQKNRQRVAEATDGRVGYLHLPNMGAEGIYEFVKWYYPQIRKEGLVVDVRANGGGNVSQWIIERLDSKLLGTWFGSRSEAPSTYPDAVFHGHLVCLISETSASDGDIFPYRFRQAGLGPLIGKRTWGGVVGITSLGPLLDGGTVFVPLVATCSPTGEYIIEGSGVEPDIEVDNVPKDVIAGRDAQLERGIEEVLNKIKAQPKSLPKRRPDPIKTR